MEEGKITFTTEDGEEIAFFVLEDTTIAGISYLLVTDSNEDEADALILKEIEGEDGEEMVYDVVEDEDELIALSKVFEELLGDVDINM